MGQGVRRVRLAFVLILATALGACAPPDKQGVHALLGAWVGEITYHDASVPLTLELAADGDSLLATLAARELGVAPVALGRFAYAPPRVHFRVPAGGDTLVFDGFFRRTLLVGTVTSHEVVGAARLVLLPQFGFQRPRKKLELAGVDSSYNAQGPAAATAPPAARIDTLAAWLRTR